MVQGDQRLRVADHTGNPSRPGPEHIAQKFRAAANGEMLAVHQIQGQCSNLRPPKRRPPGSRREHTGGLVSTRAPAALHDVLRDVDAGWNQIETPPSIPVPLRVVSESAVDETETTKGNEA